MKTLKRISSRSLSSRTAKIKGRKIKTPRGRLPRSSPSRTVSDLWNKKVDPKKMVSKVIVIKSGE